MISLDEETFYFKMKLLYFLDDALKHYTSDSV